MDTKVDWDQLGDALRDELQEKRELIRLLNQQTEALYRRDIMENERLEEQIRVQLRLISRRTQGREFALRQTASKFHLNGNVQSNEVVRSFSEYVRPLFEDLFSEVERLTSRMEERLRQNRGLKREISL